MDKETITIILPTLNEEASIGKVIDEIPVGELEDAGCLVEILVVDGNSHDHTQEIAIAKGVRLIIEKRRGKGRAVRTALEQTDADYIFMMDADYTYPAGHLPDLLAILKQGSPVVIGSRLKGKREPGSIRRLNLVGNHLLTFMANLLFFTGISDLCTGYWGFRGEVIRAINLKENGFQFEAELYSRLARNGHNIAELPVGYRLREGNSKLGGIKDGLKIGWTLLRNRLS